MKLWKLPFLKKKESPKEERGQLTDSSLSIEGHTFRVVDPMTREFTMSKRNAYFTKEYEREWGIDKNDLMAFFKQGLKQCQFPDRYSDDKNLIKQLTDRLMNTNKLLEQCYLVIQEDYQYKPFLKAACMIILMDDEKLTDDPYIMMSKKLSLCQEHSDIEVFFCRL